MTDAARLDHVTRAGADAVLFQVLKGALLWWVGPPPPEGIGEAVAY